MKETKLKAFAKLHAIIEPYDAGTVIYRGAKSVDFPLIPKIGRIVPPDLAKADEMDKILIPNSIRLTLKKTLNKYGVDRFSLFPGPDSLAAQIE